MSDRHTTMLTRGIAGIVLLFLLTAPSAFASRDHSIRGKPDFNHHGREGCGKPFYQRHRSYYRSYAAAVAVRKHRRANRGVFDFRR